MERYLSCIAGLGAFALALALPSEGRPAEVSGLYLGGTLGYAMPKDAGNSLGTTTESANAPSFRLGLGYEYAPIRVEGEIGYLKTDADTLSNPLVGAGEARDASGSTTTWSFMLNGYYDFNLDERIKPYIGLGLGAARVSVNNVTAPGFTTGDDRDTVFAAQGMLGVGYAFTPAFVGSIGYRYFWSDDVSLRDSAGTSFTADGTRTHSIELGVRYRF